MNNADIAEAAADIISDQLREQLEDSEIIDRGQYDTTLARRDGDDLTVEFIRLNENAATRSDGRVVFRVRVEAIA
jgi:hypothetical protein